MRRLRTLLTALCIVGLGVPLIAQTSINFVTPRLGTAALTSAIASITDACTATSCVQLGEAGYTSVSVQTVGTCGTCTLNFEASNDGVVWVAVNLMPVAGTTAVSSTSTAGIWQGGVSAQQFRVRQSARSSGGFVVTARATLGTASVAGSGGGGAAPAGSGSELQARLNATTLQAVTGSSFASSTLNLGADNLLTVRRVAETPDAVVSIYDNGSGKTSIVEIIADDGAAYPQRWGRKDHSGNWYHIEQANDTLWDIGAIDPISGSYMITTSVPLASASEGSEGLDSGQYLQVFAAGISSVPGIIIGPTMPLDDPSASIITQAGTPGAATVTYKLVGNTPLGYHSAAGAASTTATANATLNGTNYNLIASPALTGVVSYDIYRTAGGPSQGKLTGSPFAVGAFPVHDTGLAGDASTPTAVNTTGHIYAGAILDATLGVSDGTNYQLKWDTDALGVFANDGTTYADLRAANFIMSNSSIRGDKTDAHAWTLEAWDVNDAVSRAFMTCTNGNTPLCALATPSGGSLTGDFATLAVATVPVVTTTGSQVLANKTLTAPVITQVPVAVGSLPSCDAGTANQVAIVNDALAPALGIAVANGGALTVGVICKSGTGWLVY